MLVFAWVIPGSVCFRGLTCFAVGRLDGIPSRRTKEGIWCELAPIPIRAWACESVIRARVQIGLGLENIMLQSNASVDQ